jgi:transcriptional regulator with XRE-family HTH domain
MTPKLPSTRQARRVQLGGELRRLRQLAGVSGRDIARAIKVNPGAVSRVEKGDRPLALPQLREWAARIGVSGDDLTRLEWMAEQALTESVPLSALRATSPQALQGDISRRLEQPSRFIAAYCPIYLTGLLQTPEYARRLYSLFRPAGQVEDAVGARMERQQVLWDPARRFEFVLAEAALRWRTGDRGYLIPQLERVLMTGALPNVAVYVIPSDADQRAVELGEFVLYDERDPEPVAAAETLHDNGETANVQPYRDELALLRRSALSGDEAAAFIRDLAARL